MQEGGCGFDIKRFGMKPAHAAWVATGAPVSCADACGPPNACCAACTRPPWHVLAPITPHHLIWRGHRQRAYFKPAGTSGTCQLSRGHRRGAAVAARGPGGRGERRQPRPWWIAAARASRLRIVVTTITPTGLRACRRCGESVVASTCPTTCPVRWGVSRAFPPHAVALIVETEWPNLLFARRDRGILNPSSTRGCRRARCHGYRVAGSA